MDHKTKHQMVQIGIISALVLVVSILHYQTPTMKWQYHLVYMQAYFIPIILAAFQFGVRGGLGTAVVVCLIYLPHIMLQWGGLIETNLMRFLQLILFLVLGYLTGLKAQGERDEKDHHKKAAKDLEQALHLQQKQSEQISQMEQQLRAADRLAIVGELAASLAHEVRNPLGGIQGAAEILKKKIPSEAAEAEFVQIQLNEIQRLNQVVESYLKMAKKEDVYFQLIDFGKILLNSTKLIRLTARNKNISLETRFSDQQKILVYGDALQLKQVILNITLNAIQATEDSGKITFDLNISKDGKEVIMRINDTGPGIPKEQTGQLFDPFFTTKAEGTGLGLAIVKRIVEKHNGRVWFETNAKGTSFFVALPCVRDTNNFK